MSDDLNPGLGHVPDDDPPAAVHSEGINVNEVVYDFIEPPPLESNRDSHIVNSDDEGDFPGEMANQIN
jgi:hypothetical protein